MACRARNRFKIRASALSQIVTDTPPLLSTVFHILSFTPPKGSARKSSEAAGTAKLSLAVGLLPERSAFGTEPSWWDDAAFRTGQERRCYAQSRRLEADDSGGGGADQGAASAAMIAARMASSLPASKPT